MLSIGDSSASVNGPCSSAVVICTGGSENPAEIRKWYELSLSRSYVRPRQRGTGLQFSQDFCGQISAKVGERAMTYMTRLISTWLPSANARCGMAAATCTAQ